MVIIPHKAGLRLPTGYLAVNTHKPKRVLNSVGAVLKPSLNAVSRALEGSEIKLVLFKIVSFIFLKAGAKVRTIFENSKYFALRIFKRMKLFSTPFLIYGRNRRFSLKK